MSSIPDWIPKLTLLDDFGGDWNRYIDHLFSIFYKDFIESQPKFQNCWVRCRRDPIYDGKEAGFWHCTSDGTDEKTRVPDLRRCERIGWVRAVIEHVEDSRIDCWSNTRNSEKRWLLWFNEEFLVVLAERIRKSDDFRYMQLITSYCTVEQHRRVKLRKERDAYRQT